jgi:hypothetical protein
LKTTLGNIPMMLEENSMKGTVESFCQVFWEVFDSLSDFIVTTSGA